LSEILSENNISYGVTTNDKVEYNAITIDGDDFSIGDLEEHGSKDTSDNEIGTVGADISSDETSDSSGEDSDPMVDLVEYSSTHSSDETSNFSGENNDPLGDSVEDSTHSSGDASNSSGEDSDPMVDSVKYYTLKSPIIFVEAIDQDDKRISLPKTESSKSYKTINAKKKMKKYKTKKKNPKSVNVEPGEKEFVAINNMSMKTKFKKKNAPNAHCNKEEKYIIDATVANRKLR